MRLGWEVASLAEDATGIVVNARRATGAGDTVTEAAAAEAPAEVTPRHQRSRVSSLQSLC